MQKYAVEIMDRKGNSELWTIAYENELAEAKRSAKAAYPDFIVTVSKIWSGYSPGN